MMARSRPPAAADGRQRRHWWILLAAVGMLAVAWLATPGAVPIYDGVGIPDEPYRYVSPPAGDQIKTKPPTTASQETGASNGTNPDPVAAQSAEQSPQVIVHFSVGSLHGPVNATGFRVTATPQAPLGNLPNGASFDGNMYHVTVQPQGANGEVTVKPDRQVTGDVPGIVLRATTTQQPGPAMIYRGAGSGSWKVLQDSQVGTDSYRADLPGLGDFAMAWGMRASSSGGSFPALPVALGAVGAALVALVLLIRLRRTRSA